MNKVYKHINKLNNEVFYVGVGKANRAFDFRSYRRNKKWNAIKNNIGTENIQVEIVAQFEDLKQALNLEKELTLKYKSKNQCQANIKISLDCDEETREKISKANKNKFSGENNPFYGKHHSQKSIEKIKASRTGQKRSKESIEKQRNTMNKKVLCITDDLVFDSKKLASKHYNIPIQSKYVKEHTKIGMKKLGRIIQFKYVEE